MSHKISNKSQNKSIFGSHIYLYTIHTRFVSRDVPSLTSFFFLTISQRAMEMNVWNYIHIISNSQLILIHIRDKCNSRSISI